MLDSAQPADTRLRALLALWHERRGERCFPSRQDFSPFDFAQAGVMGYIALVEIHRTPGIEKPRLKMRLMGVRVVERIGFDPTGKWLDELIAEPDFQAYMQNRIQEVVEARRPLVDLHIVEVDGRAPRTSEAIRVPLSSDGETIDMALTCVVFVDRD